METTQADRIRSKLALRRLSARRAARLLGLSPLTMYRRLTGEIPWRTCELLALAAILEVPFTDISADGKPFDRGGA